MEVEKIAGLPVRVFREELEVCIPIKLFCEDILINFGNTLVYFNSLHLNVDQKMKLIGGVEYLCYSLEDFILFLFVISGKESKLMKYRKLLCKDISKRTLISQIKMMDDIAVFVNSKFIIPKDGDEVCYITATAIYDMLPKQLKSITTAANVGSFMKKNNYKRISKKIDRVPRYCYEVARIAE